MYSSKTVIAEITSGIFATSNSRSFSTAATTASMISKIGLVSKSFESPCDITGFITVVLTSLPDDVSHIGYLIFIERTAKVSERTPRR
jgi:hypothetical protein